MGKARSLSPLNPKRASASERGAAHNGTELHHSHPLSAESARRHEPGLQPEIVYKTSLSPWRESLRQWLFSRLEWDSNWIANLQAQYRTPARDRYFFWSAVFGTHTFFTAFLPLLFFLGYQERGRGLVYVVGLGIYVSCVAKDLACTPRPFTPPVTRLSVSTHHQEYGFPSSHSTNSISIALYLGQWLWELRQCVGYLGVAVGWTLLLFYYASVAGGRLYTGMHSIADIVGGSLLGVFCWVAWQIVKPWADAFVESGSVIVPSILVPLALALVHYHPETPDDCPCFEDAIAIISVILGVLLGHQYYHEHPPAPGLSVWAHDGAFWGVTALVVRIVVGIVSIFVWRLIAKATFLRVLPPLFRLVSKVLDRPLPTRRFYLSANTYDEANTSFHAVPSFMNLAGHNHPSSPLLKAQHDPRRSPSPVSLHESPLHMRVRRKLNEANGNGNGNGNGDAHSAKAQAQASQADKRGVPHLEGAPGFDPIAGNSSRHSRHRPHYDAEVLTKFMVYTGIGFLASTVVPLAFHALEMHERAGRLT